MLQTLRTTLKYSIAISVLSSFGYASDNDVETTPKNPFFEAYSTRAHKISQAGLSLQSLSQEEKQQLHQLDYLLSEESLPERIIPFKERLKSLGSIMFVGGTFLQEYISGSIDQINGNVPSGVHWGRLAIAQATTVMVDGLPIDSSFRTSFSVEPSRLSFAAQYSSRVLSLALEKYVEQKRIFPCYFEEIPSSYKELFNTVLFDGSVYYNMGKKWKEIILNGAKRFVKKEGLFILPMADNDFVKTEYFIPLKQLFQEDGHFEFVEFVGKEECIPYKQYSIIEHDRVSSYKEQDFPDATLYKSFFAELGSHLLADFNKGWGLAIWKRKS